MFSIYTQYFWLYPTVFLMNSHETPTSLPGDAQDAGEGRVEAWLTFDPWHNERSALVSLISSWIFFLKHGILFINHIDITDITPNLILVAGLIHQLSQRLGHPADRPWLQETELLHGVGHVRLNADGTCWTLMTAADQLSLGGVEQ